MAYCSKDDVENVLNAALVAQTATEPDADEPDWGVVETVCVRASAEVDSYCGGRYATPFSPTPDVVRWKTADIAAYLLLVRRGFVEEDADTPIGKRYRDAVRWLTDVSKGDAHIPTSAATPEPSEQLTAVVSRPKLFSEDGLAGY
ncbi:MAG: DUF1320 domain-containing protein [Myxococcales bacterium]|nr:DUF1320 domain-containing protein [Myxococcales bacterium]